MAIWDRILEWVIGYGGRAIGAAITLVLGYLAARLLRRVVRRVMSRFEPPPAIISFVSRLVYVAVLLFAVVAALSRFGVETTSFVAVLGAGSFAVGFALQGALSNFAAGVLILILRPFGVGDYVEVAGVGGTVKDIQLFSTVLATPDNVKVLVPNARVYGDTIKNYAGYETRRLDLSVGIGYDASIDRAIEVASTLLAADSRVLADPPPQVLVSQLGDSSVDLTLRMWVERSDFWPVRHELTRRIKSAFDEHGIEIPFPQRVVHLRREP